MAATTPSLFVFIDDIDDVFASPNASYIPPIPTLQNIFTDDCDPRDCLRIKFDQNKYPYIGFSPMYLRYKGVIFGRLDLSKCDHIVELVPGTDRWRMRPELSASWRRLEGALQMMGTVVSDKTSQGYVHLEFKFPPFPNTYGYLREHKTKRFAMKSILRSRAAFTPVVAWCAWNFAKAGGKLYDPIPRWYHILESAGVHVEWLNEMCRNEIGDFSGNVKCVGLFVHLARCSWLNIVQTYIKANIPIWFYWGNTRHGYVKNYDPWVQSYRPTSADILKAIRKRDETPSNVPNQHDKPQNNDMQIETPDSPLAPPESQFPSLITGTLAPPESQFPNPIKGSRQRHGEHWKDFFERMEEEQRLIAANETPEQRQSRLDREKHQSRHPFPGKKGPICWRWELVNGFRLRTPVTRGEVEDIWDTIPNEHRRYNSFTNVWDINPEFDPNVDEEYFSDDDVPERYPSPIPRSPPSPLPVSVSSAPTALPALPLTDSNPNHPEIQPASVFPSLVYNDLIKVVGTTVCETTFDPENIEDVLFFRYGFLHNQLPCAPWASIMSSDDLLPWRTLRLVLGDGRATPGKSFCDAVAQFTCCMLSLTSNGGSRAEQSKDVLRHTCDLHDDLRDMLKQDSSAVRVRPIQFTDRVVRYLLQAHVPSDWYVVLDSALSAVECLRRPERKVEDIVARLTRQGIPFRTITAGPPPSPRPPPISFGLGYYPKDYQMTAVNYTAYERARDEFLRGPRGRAALMKGGIIWRLAKEVLHEDFVIAGPSESLYQTGICFSHKDTGKYWWDDDLSVGEMDFICGVYKVFTGHGFQISDMSWWPKHSAWESSGADFGYWSATSENWFQKRLAEIRNGTATLRNGGHWTNALSFQRKTRRFINTNEALATKYLTGSPVF